MKRNHFLTGVFSFLILAVVFTFSAPLHAESEIKVGSWNIRDLSFNSRDWSEIKLIAQVITNLDCVAICEVNDASILGKLVEELNRQSGTWKAVQTKTKVGNSPSSKEFYGFVFRSDKIKSLHAPKSLKKVSCAVPEINSTIRFDREPAECSFASTDGHFDFTMVVVHITWGSGKPQKELVARREAEIRALKGYFEQVRDKETKDKDVILCGDFNCNSGESPGLADLLTIPSMIDTTDADTPTKIDTKNTYDHLLFQTNFVKEYAGRHGVIKFDETMFGNDDKKASLACSDHRPVWVSLVIPGIDDD